ncbi:MAG: hypothetical protein AAF823_08385 [Planctomycetota bacterium]
MSEPGKANLWKSWVRWVSLSFSAAALGGLLLIWLAGAVALTVWGSEPMAGVVLGLGMLLFVLLLLGGVVWSCFVRPPLQAGDVRHMRWKDRPKKLMNSLMFAPISLALGAGVLMLGVPAMTWGFHVLSEDPYVDRFPYVGWFLWLGGITAVLLGIGWPVRRLTERRFRRALAVARVCVECGYDLRGTNAAACPECGTPTVSVSK